MYDFDLNEKPNEDYQLMFKLNGKTVSVVWFDSVNVEGDGWISLFLFERNVALVDVHDNPNLNNALKVLKKRYTD